MDNAVSGEEAIVLGEIVNIVTTNEDLAHRICGPDPLPYDEKRRIILFARLCLCQVVTVMADIRLQYPTEFGNNDFKIGYIQEDDLQLNFFSS